MSPACPMIVLVQESTRFLPDVPGYPNVVPALREIVIGAVLVLFLRFRPKGLLPERRYVSRLPHGRVGSGVDALPAGRPGISKHRSRLTRDRDRRGTRAFPP